VRDRIGAMFTIYRRHLKACPHRPKGRAHLKCGCPLSLDITTDTGKRRRVSLKTADMARARKRAIALESEDRPPSKAITDAVAAFLDSMSDRAHGTQRNNRRILGHFLALCGAAGVQVVESIDLELIDRYRASRAIAASTWAKELEIIRHFLAYCMARKWIGTNPAKEIRAHKPKPTEKKPYTPEEVVKIIAACDSLGLGAYERLRARAMVLLMRHAALRVSDVALLKRESIQGGKLNMATIKTGAHVRLPLDEVVLEALENLPAPRGEKLSQKIDSVSSYYFWSGNGTTRSAIRDVERTLHRVFELSGVAGAHAHRFRHTLATEIMEREGGDAQVAATILGITPAIVLRHYAQWSIKRQERIESLLQTVFGASLAHEKKQAANA
jgi:site-specific recombinase XerD